MIKIALSCVILLVWGASCSPSKKSCERKLRKIEKKCPSLTDTITILDTVIVPRYIHDTVTNLIYNDSVTVINNDRVRLKYIYDTVTNQIHHEVDCKENTIVKEYKTTRVVNNYPTWWEQIRSIWPLILIALAVLAYLKLRRKIPFLP